MAHWEFAMNGMKRMVWGGVLVILGMLSCPSSLWAAGSPQADRADLRVLIDISGSMKQNDPKNLRRPALRLLVGLLPEGTRAGVWTFARYVNMQIPLAVVDPAWKRKARLSSRRIASPGQFTNIEAALKRATADWSGPPGPFRRSLILLTDGKVDISRNRSKNQASRQRILEKVLPRLRRLGVTIHTIALSKNADHELMRRLAETTGGWFEQVEDAEQLQKVFLRLFEKVGRPDTVPLQDNRFTIDASISEATVLVFHKPGAQATQLIPPGGQSFGREQAPKSVKWHRDQGYDMLTISDPQPGEWRIRAQLDPDNRVMVVTDLKIHTSPLPNRLIQGQDLFLEAEFTDHGKQITRHAFLNRVEVKARRQDRAGEEQTWPLRDDGQGADIKAGDGTFSLRLGGDRFSPGQAGLVISGKGPTFQRERHLTFTVVPPVELAITPGEGQGHYRLQVTPDTQLVDPTGLEAQVWLQDEAGKTTPVSLRQAPKGVRQGELDLMGFTGTRRVVVQAKGRTLQGQALNYRDSPTQIEGLMPKPAPVPVEPDPAASPTPVVPAQPSQSTPAEVVEDDWVMTAVGFSLVNLLLLGAAGAGFWWLRRRGRNERVSLVDEPRPEDPATTQEMAA